MNTTNINPPVPRKRPHNVLFGRVRSDNQFRGQEDQLIDPPLSHNDDYFWLRDDSRTNTEVLDIVKRENAYTESILSTHQDLQTKIFGELKGYMKDDYSTYPLQEHSSLSPFKYYRQFKSGSGYYQYIQLDSRDGKTLTLLDINLLAQGKPQCDVTSLSCSLDEKYFSYCVDFDGSEKYKLVISEIKSSQQIDTTPIPLISYGDYGWVGNDRIVYTQSDESNRPYQLWTWKIGTSQPTMLYEESIQDLSIGFYTSGDNKYLFVVSSDYDSTSTQFGEIELLVKGGFSLTKISDPIKNFKYSVQHLNGQFYIKNNLNAVNWKVSTVPVSQVQNICDWVDFIPSESNVFVKSFGITQYFAFVGLKINGGSYLGIIDMETVTNLKSMYITNFEDFTNIIPLDKYLEYKWSEFWPQSVYSLNTFSYFWDSPIIYLSIDKMTQPYSLLEFNIRTKIWGQVYSKEVPGYNPKDYTSSRIYTQTSDGKAVPISLIYKKGTVFPAPTYLYGYGSYGHTVEPNFDYQVLPLLNRGWVYAIAHVRGGSFLGYDWYLQGKGMKKLNTFNDFISCAEHLIKNGFSLPKSITCEGRSAGGLLVGASMVLRPDLFSNVIMGVPFLDVLNTMCDSSIPLTVEEWTQWGNPNIKTDYDYMSLYCPYTNLKPGIKYPNIFATGGLHDPRVQYWEPLKFISKLRAGKAPTDTSIQNLKIEMTQGHFGGSDRYKHLKETAEKYTWILTR